MTNFVAMLRGINVGGRSSLPMSDLRRITESCGHADVRTYIQSGNVVFSTPGRPSAAKVATELRRKIAAQTSVDPDIAVRTRAQMEKVVASNPFLADGVDPAHLHVVFLVDDTRPAAVNELDLDRYTPESLVVRGHEVYLHLPNGMGRSKLAADLARKRDAVGTARNWRTVTKLAEMVAAT
jgi:uncharacterized protein (DUF1697 family)